MAYTDEHFIAAIIEGHLRDVDKHNPFGQTALMVAVECGDVASARRLLRNGANSCAKSALGVTSLMKAASLVSCELTQILLWADAAIDAKNNEGDTALMCAAASGSADNVELLINHGAKLDLHNKDGVTALIQAIENGALRSVRWLLSGNADENLADSEGNTPLMWACAFGHEEIVRLLLAAGADPALLNAKGDSASNFAIHGGHAEIVALLKDYTSFQARLAAIHYEAEPDSLCRCPISFEVMNDPVTVSSGRSYDRKSLRDYFRSRGNPDVLPCPLTRLEIRREELNHETNASVMTLIERFVSDEERKHRQRMDMDRPRSSSVTSVMFFQKSYRLAQDDDMPVIVPYHSAS